MNELLVQRSVWKDLWKNDFDQLMRKLISKDNIRKVYVQQKAFLLASTLEHFKSNFPHDDIQLYKKFVMEMCARLYKHQNGMRCSVDNLMIFTSYCEFIMAILNQSRWAQNEKDVQRFMNEISYSLQIDKIGQLFETIHGVYIECEQRVKESGLVMNDNHNDGVFRFRLKQSAVYHWIKHSVEDIYEYKFKIKEDMINAKEYLLEANHTIHMNIISNHQTNYSLNLEADDIYNAHERFTSVNVEEKELITYYKKLR